MNAEARGLNTGNASSVFPVSAGGVPHPVRVDIADSFYSVFFSGSGSSVLTAFRSLQRRAVKGWALGLCSTEGLEFPDAERQRAEVLARGNGPVLYLAYRRHAIGRGKVRRGPSVGRRVGMLRLWRGAGRKVQQLWKLEALDRVRYEAYLLQRRAEGRRGLFGRAALKTPKARRAALREWETERLEERLRQLAAAQEDEFPPENWTVKYLALLESFRQESGRDEAWVIREAWRHGILRSLLTYSILFRDWATVRRVMRFVKGRARIRAAAATAHLLEKLSLFRAHLSRRVQPISRRSRIPRPLYARPRPPAAPLAPPT
jgi:hypothetical protein